MNRNNQNNYSNGQDNNGNRGVVPPTDNPEPSTSARAGQRNSGYKGKNYNPEYRRPKPNVAAKGSGFPQPKNLSQSSTTMRNDPLYAENYFVDPSCELREKGAIRTITPECTGLPGLVEASYKLISATNQNFARLIRVNEMNQYSIDSEASRFVHSVEEGKYKLPKLLSLYINGYGNFSPTDGRNIHLRMPDKYFRHLTDEYDDEDNVIVGGYFGKIQDNPDLYTYLPSLGVSAQRIIQDLSGTGIWDLPPRYKYDGHSINERTTGYRPAVTIGPQAKQTLEECRITDKGFESVHPKYCFNPDLMGAIMTKLDGTRDLTLHEINLETPVGSLGQEIICKPLVTNSRVATCWLPYQLH